MVILSLTPQVVVIITDHGASKAIMYTFYHDPTKRILSDFIIVLFGELRSPQLQDSPPHSAAALHTRLSERYLSSWAATLLARPYLLKSNTLLHKARR